MENKKPLNNCLQHTFSQTPLYFVICQAAFWVTILSPPFGSMARNTLNHVERDPGDGDDTLNLNSFLV